jgi:hypothetical protein
MNINKATKRDNKRRKRKYGHIVDSKSTLEIERLQRERAEAIKKKRKQKLLEELEFYE